MKYIMSVLAVIIVITACTLTEKKPQKEPQQMKKVLFVLTSHDQLGNTGEKTGFWIEEFAAPYYTLKDEGVNITLASPKGGQPPIDPKSAADDAQTPATKRFNADKETQQLLANTAQLDKVNATDYDAVFYPGGHGPLWDLSENPTSIKLIESFYQSNKPVAAVCHAPAVFKSTKNVDGTPLVQGKKVTGFSNAEEEAVQLTDVVPFLVEEMLKENGGTYSKADNWNPHAVQDGLLITGQNPASSEKVAEMLLEAL
jgi:putative intracellular protease/amidase